MVLALQAARRVVSAKERAPGEFGEPSADHRDDLGDHQA
jgi:hypothetical protein